MNVYQYILYLDQVDVWHPFTLSRFKLIIYLSPFMGANDQFFFSIICDAVTSLLLFWGVDYSDYTFWVDTGIQSYNFTLLPDYLKYKF